METAKQNASIISPAPVSGAQTFSYAVPDATVASPARDKLPLFVMLFVVFSFSLFAYSAIGLDSGPLFRILHYDVTIAKLTSSFMIVFLISICAALALAAFASKGIELLDALALTGAASFIPALGLGFLVYHDYLYPFICFALAIISAAFFSNRKKPEEISLSSAYSVINSALLIFTLSALLFSYVAASQNRDKYFDQFFFGIAEIAPVAASSAAGGIATALDSYQVTQSTIDSTFPKDIVRGMLNQSSLFAMMPPAQQDGLVNTTYSSIFTVQNANGLKSAAAQSLRDYAAKPVKETTKADAEALKAQVKDMDSYKQLYDMFAIAVPLMVLSLVTFAKIPVQLVGTFFTYILMKVL